jgi:hypothetical protein
VHQADPPPGERGRQPECRERERDHRGHDDEDRAHLRGRGLSTGTPPFSRTAQ